MNGAAPIPAMPRAEILSKRALHTLTQLHSELAGKIETNRKCLVTSYSPLESGGRPATESTSRL
jgi:hypothetical protein